MKLQIAISPVLVDQKYPSGDQIQGLDATYLQWTYRVMLLTILTLVLAENSNAFFFYLHFAGLKGQYTSKLLLGLENRLKTKVFTCIKKITKMRLMRYRIIKKKTVFWNFQVRKASGGQSNTGNRFMRNFTSTIDFRKFFSINLSLW